MSIFIEEKILKAIEEKDKNFLKKIISDKNSDISFRINTPIQLAAKSGDMELFLMFYNDSRTDLNDYADNIITYAYLSENKDIINFVLSKINLTYDLWFECLKTCYNNIYFLREIFNINKEYRYILKNKNKEGYKKLHKKIINNNIKNF
jgi:DNA polymerase III delta prime subunit